MEVEAGPYLSSHRSDLDLIEYGRWVKRRIAASHRAIDSLDTSSFGHVEFDY